MTSTDVQELTHAINNMPRSELSDLTNAINSIPSIIMDLANEMLKLKLQLAELEKTVNETKEVLICGLQKQLKI